jgi:outer membrane protein assembly factor BamB
MTKPASPLMHALISTPRVIVAGALLTATLSSVTVAQTPTDWTTFGGSAQRTGYNASESILSTSTVPSLRLLWSRQIGGSSDAQPLLVRQVATAKGTRDAVFAASKGGVVLALNASDGAILWNVTLSHPKIECTGGTSVNSALFDTPTIDLVTQRMFVVDGGGLLHALHLGSGTEASGYPVQVVDLAGVGHGTEVYSSPTMVGQMLYIATAHYTSCGPEGSQNYQGQVIRYDLGLGRVTKRWFPAAPLTGGGIWGPGGVSAEADGSALYAATGNAATPGQPQNAHYADKVVKLDRSLNVLAANGPNTPTGDFDFGATPLPFHPPGCSPLLAAMDKNGALYLYDRTAIGSGPLQSLQVTTGAGSFIGIPAYDPVNNAIFLGNPSDSPSGMYSHGLLGFGITASCRLSLVWQYPAGLNNPSGGNPVIPATVANGVVWWGDGIAGQLLAVAAATGQPLWNSGSLIAPGGIFAAPTVANGNVFVIGGGTIYAFGL